MKFDTSMLTRPLTRAETDEVQRRDPETFAAWARVDKAMGSVWILVIAVCWAFAYFSTGIVRVLLLVIPVPGAVYMWLFLRRRRQQSRQVAVFAVANNFDYEPSGTTPDYPWLLPPSATELASDERLISHQPGSLVEAGCHTFPAPEHESGRATWNYLVFRLSQPMPHLVLKSSRHEPSTRWKLPIPYPGSESYPLSDGWKAYAEPEHRDQVSVMFPDELLRTLAGLPVAMDIEVSDTWLFCYSSIDLRPFEPGTWQVAAVVDAEVVSHLSGLERRDGDPSAI